MLTSKCPLCGCTGLHACMGNLTMPSDGSIYSMVGNKDLVVELTEEISKMFEKSVDEDTS